MKGRIKPIKLLLAVLAVIVLLCAILAAGLWLWQNRQIELLPEGVSVEDLTCEVYYGGNALQGEVDAQALGQVLAQVKYTRLIEPDLKEFYSSETRDYASVYDESKELSIYLHADKGETPWHMEIVLSPTYNYCVPEGYRSHQCVLVDGDAVYQALMALCVQENA